MSEDRTMDDDLQDEFDRIRAERDTLAVRVAGLEEENARVNDLRVEARYARKLADLWRERCRTVSGQLDAQADRLRLADDLGDQLSILAHHPMLRDLPAAKRAQGAISAYRAGLKGGDA